MNTKFQQIGRTGDSINNDDWFYFPFGVNDANRVDMQQVFVQGSFEGCINQIYYFYDGSNWKLYRQVLTVDTVIDPDTLAQRVMWHLQKGISFNAPLANKIPCDHQTLFFHPYQKFFFYYYSNSEIISIDRGFTDTSGNACTTTVTPTGVNAISTAIASANYVTDPAFYKGFTYFSIDSTSGYSVIYRWDVVMNAGGTSLTTDTLTAVLTLSAGEYVRDLKGMDDVGLFYVINGQNGYYIQKINSANGNIDGAATIFENTKSWAIYQAPYNDENDLRPVWLANTAEPSKFYKGTNVLSDHFTGSGTQYDFFQWPVQFGKYYAMQIRPGTCAQEGGSEDYNFLHVNVLSIRDKAHSYCIDDSEDIFCGNGKWEEYNLEECDDGGTANNDGCDSNCKIEARWTCNNVVNQTSTCSYVACGNGYLDNAASGPYAQGEQCDDGNILPGDGCSATCQIEDCYYCTGVGTGSCTLQCENSVINSNTYWSGVPTQEVCDEGTSKTDALGCLNCCTAIQTGYKCGAAGTECTPRCYDGIRDDPDLPWTTTTEACDDNNDVAGDGCASDCSAIDPGYECLYAGGACREICGNGHLDASGTPAINGNGDAYSQGTYTAEQ